MISRPLALFVPAFVAYLTTAAPVDVVAGVPGTLTYQGLLTDQSGTPVTDTLPIAFRLYGSVSAGSPFWSETQTITLIEGRLSAILGANTSGNPLPKEAFTGETYIELQPDANGDGNLTELDTPMPRQRLSSVAYAFRAAYAEAAPSQIPSGVIVMWSGAVNAVPNGWVLCNGQNGTPDLRDRFIVGAGGGYGAGATGGESVHTLTVNELPSHNHNVDPPYTLTSEDGNHRHRISTQNAGGENEGVGESDNNGSRNTADTEDAGVHRHAVDIPAFGSSYYGGGQAHENRPPYYALAFIMKQ
jgi:microcystin-dependent protein